MSAPWHALFIPLEDAACVEAALRAALVDLGYRPYDPFPGGTGTPSGLADLVRGFVAPSGEGWTRVLGPLDAAAFLALSASLGMPLLEGWLVDGEGGFAVWQTGVRDTSADALAAFLRPDRPRAALERALRGEGALPAVPPDAPAIHVIAADALPPDVAALAQAHGVNPRQADKLVQRLSGSLFGKLNRQAGGSDDETQAQARMLLAGQADSWAAPEGQRVQALASVLALPSHWRDPSWEAVRDAYQLRRLRQRSPRLPLMPGDQQTLDAVPDALDYRPVYMGRGPA